MVLSDCIYGEASPRSQKRWPCHCVTQPFNPWTCEGQWQLCLLLRQIFPIVRAHPSEKEWWVINTAIRTYCKIHIDKWEQVRGREAETKKEDTERKLINVWAFFILFQFFLVGARKQMERGTERAKINFTYLRSAWVLLTQKTLDWESWKWGKRKENQSCSDIWGSLARVRSGRMYNC